VSAWLDLVQDRAVVVDGCHREGSELVGADDPGAEVVVDWAAVLVPVLDEGQELTAGAAMPRRLVPSALLEPLQTMVSPPRPRGRRDR
jgi:hypothetical protein